MSFGSRKKDEIRTMVRRENRNAVVWKVMNKKSGASGVLSAHRSQVSMTRTTDHGAKMMLICVKKIITQRIKLGSKNPALVWVPICWEK